MRNIVDPQTPFVSRLARADRPTIAYRQTDGAAPVIVFFPGYASDMSGSKASAIFDWAAARGQACLLFDYAGCGQSGGDFATETIESWRDDALAVIEARTAPDAQLVLVGSSMGGWLMLLVARAFPSRIAAMMGIAPAPDFTQWGYSDAQKAQLARDGRLYEENPYGPDPTLTTYALWQSGQRNLLLDASPDALIDINCPVALIHGTADADVPYAISERLAAQLRSAQVRVQLVRDADHRLSRPEDIDRMLATLAQLIPTMSVKER